MTNHRLLIVASLTLAALALPACRGTATPADPKLAAELSVIPYPGSAKLGDDLDIVVDRHRTDLQLTNRTPRSYHDVQLWLNQQYVAKVEKIDIGTGNTIALSRFVNQHGEEYPAGTFLTPDLRFPVLLAELFDPATGMRHRLLVQMER